jgi:Phage major capsid protein E
MPSLDTFNDDAFKLQTMLPAIEGLDYLPQRLGQLGIFTPTPVRTAKVSIESHDGKLSVIQTSLRGAPLEQRNIREFKTVRIPKGDRITASELADVRAFGTETEVMAVHAEINRRLAGPMGLISDIELTLENMRLGCVQNEVRDADGTKIYNWLDEFSITVLPNANEWDFPFADPAFNQGGVRQLCTEISRAMAVNSKGAWRERQSRPHCLCGDVFWDRLTACEEVRKTFLNWEGAAALREGNAYGEFNFGGVTFENYSGLDMQSGSVLITEDKAAFFPANAPGVFLEVFAPGETFEDLGEPGKRVYPKIIPDRQRGFYADLEVYCYPLHVCTRPSMLQVGWSA